MEQLGINGCPDRECDDASCEYHAFVRKRAADEDKLAGDNEDSGTPPAKRQKLDDIEESQDSFPVGQKRKQATTAAQADAIELEDYDDDDATEAPCDAHDPIESTPANSEILFVAETPIRQSSPSRAHQKQRARYHRIDGRDYKCGAYHILHMLAVRDAGGWRGEGKFVYTEPRHRWTGDAIVENGSSLTFRATNDRGDVLDVVPVATSVWQDTPTIFVVQTPQPDVKVVGVWTYTKGMDAHVERDDDGRWPKRTVIAANLVLDMHAEQIEASLRKLRAPTPQRPLSMLERRHSAAPAHAMLASSQPSLAD
jgi:hypothetical protein